MSDFAEQNVEQRCGYVALLGRPNVGKSTLLNHVLRQKIAITSRKPQTTRHNMLGVDTEGAHQAIYVDTPGIHNNVDRALNRYMVGEAKSVLHDVDLRVVLIEAGLTQAPDRQVLRLLEQVDGPSICVLSKVDQVKDKTRVLPQLEALHKTGLFTDLIPLSALKGDGLAEFRKLVFHALPKASHLFGPDEVTDQTERALVAEIVREKLMRQLGDELPHSVAVRVERFVEQGDRSEIYADIYVERDGQKRIVIGEQGARLKKIGQDARVDIERLLDQRVMLHLWVKVRKGWTNSSHHLRQLGYD